MIFRIIPIIVLLFCQACSTINQIALDDLIVEDTSLFNDITDKYTFDAVEYEEGHTAIERLFKDTYINDYFKINNTERYGAMVLICIVINQGLDIEKAFVFTPKFEIDKDLKNTIIFAIRKTKNKWHFSSEEYKNTEKKFAYLVPLWVY